MGKENKHSSIWLVTHITIVTLQMVHSNSFSSACLAPPSADGALTTSIAAPGAVEVVLF